MSAPDLGFRIVDLSSNAGGGNVPRDGRYARLSEPRREVRRCGRCAQPAVIVCQAWEHSVGGHDTGQVTRDCRCQACGTNVTLRDPAAIRAMRILGIVFIIFVVVGPALLLLAWRRARAWDRNPLVPDAPRPAVRFWRGPGNRRCGACGGIARLTSVTRNRTNGIPTGTVCTFECACRRTFSTESWGGLFINFLAIALFVGGGALALVERKSGWMWAVLPPAAIIGGLIGLWSSLKKVHAAFVNPRLDGADAAG